MSWLFGLNKGQQTGDISSIVQLPTGGGSGDDSGDKSDSQGQKTMEAYRFDSAALERAAKAAKELELSRTFATNLYLVFQFMAADEKMRECGATNQ